NLLLPPDSRRFAAAQAFFRACLRLPRAARGWFRPAAPPSPNARYPLWITLNEPTPADLEKQRKSRLPGQPTVSLLVARADVPPARLGALLDSVLVQTYEGWEVCVAAGDVQDAESRALLRRYAENDPRVRADFQAPEPGGGGNANTALALASGDYVAL